MPNSRKGWAVYLREFLQRQYTDLNVIVILRAETTMNIFKTCSP